MAHGWNVDMMRNIGAYEVIRLIGKGGMSEVYEVENTRLGSRHALKLFACEKVTEWQET